MNEVVQQHWNNKMLPGLDCILYADGTVVILNVYAVIDSKGNKTTYIAPVCDSTIQSIEKYNDDIWTEIEINPNHLLLQNGDLIKCGEGCMGNEGFVCCEDATGKIKWAFFCSELNPFHSPEIISDGSIRVSTTNDYIMVIDLRQPWKITEVRQTR